MSPSREPHLPLRARRPRRARAVVTLIAALMTLAVACGSAPTTDAERFGGRVYRQTPGTGGTLPVIDPGVTTTVVPDGSATAAPGPYEVSVTPYSCPFDRTSANRLKVECVNVVVPMRRDQPKGAKVYLTVARIKSTSKTPQPDPVVYLDGGPGGSAIAAIDNWTNPVSPLLADRDVILIDQRGTGFSLPRLNCDRAFVESPKGEFDDRVPEATKCVSDLVRDKIDPSAFNTTESAADIADIRKALKIPQWNLFGISYGTRLALWVMATHPEGVRSVVIDSVYPPAFAKGMEDTAPGLNRAIEALISDCDAQPACRAVYPDLRGALRGTIDRLNAQPLTRRVYDPVAKKRVELDFGGGQFVLALFQAMYHTEVMPDIPKAISLAARGDVGQALDLLAGAGYFERTEEDDRAERPRSARQRPIITDGLNAAVECAETAPGTTEESIATAAAGLTRQWTDPVVLFRQRELQACGAWNVPPKPLTEVHSDIPTLVLAGTYDPITPPAWGEHAASLLTDVRMTTVIGAGHAAFFSGDCPQQLVKQFLLDPAAPGPDCTGAPPTFTR